MADDLSNGIELPEELLELVAGGVIDSSYQRKIREFADGLIDNGISLDQALGALNFLTKTENGIDMLAIVKQVFTDRII